VTTTLRKALARIQVERDRVEMAAVNELLSLGRAKKAGGRKPGRRRAPARVRRRMLK
jgi:hypothetical protein